MIGVFVPWSDRSGKWGKAMTGWVIDGDGCHIWTGARDQSGYGQVSVGGRILKVHRVRYEREIGPVPEGMVLDHYVCDNGPRGCCNPHHCRPVTRRENNLRSDSAAARNASVTHCKRGHPLTPGNLVRYDLDRGRRRCAECTRIRKSGRLHTPTCELRDSLDAALGVKSPRAPLPTETPR